MNEDDMEIIAHIITSVLNETAQEGAACQLAASHQKVLYSFDAILGEAERIN